MKVERWAGLEIQDQLHKDREERGGKIHEVSYSSLNIIAAGTTIRL